MITVKDISLINEGRVIIRDFSYEFPEGSLTGILAPVEERLSFLIQMISGITDPTTGSIIIDGTDILNATPIEIKRIRTLIGYVFDRGGLISNLSIRENLLLPLDFYFADMTRQAKLEKIASFFDFFSLPISLLDERPAKVHPQILKMILLLRAFIPEPKIILYDNPFGDLEFGFKKKIFSYIASLHEKKITQIFVSTSDHLLELADNDLVFSAGEFIEAGPWDQLLFSTSPVTQRIIKEYLEVGINET